MLTCPIRHRAAGNFGEVVLRGGEALFPGKKQLLLALLSGRLNQTAIGALIAGNVAVVQHKAGGLHHLAADFLKGAGAKVRHADRFPVLHFLPQLFKAGKKHPCVLGNHRLIPVFSGHLAAALDKHGKQIALAVGIVLFHKIRQLAAHAGAAHIRWVGHHHIVLLRQRLGHLHQR